LPEHVLQVLLESFQSSFVDPSRLLLVIGYNILHLCAICNLLFVLRETNRVLSILNKIALVERLVSLTNTKGPLCLVLFYQLAVHCVINGSYLLYYLIVDDVWDDDFWPNAFLLLSNLVNTAKFMAISQVAMLFVGVIVLVRAYFNQINAELGKGPRLERVQQLRSAYRRLSEVVEEVDALFGHHSLLALTLINVYFQVKGIL